MIVRAKRCLAIISLVANFTDTQARHYYLEIFTPDFPTRLSVRTASATSFFLFLGNLHIAFEFCTRIILRLSPVFDRLPWSAPAAARVVVTADLVRSCTLQGYLPSNQASTLLPVACQFSKSRLSHVDPTCDAKVSS